MHTEHAWAAWQLQFSTAQWHVELTENISQEISSQVAASELSPSMTPNWVDYF